MDPILFVGIPVFEGKIAHFLAGILLVVPLLLLLLLPTCWGFQTVL
jgi:hypothetical protein